MDREKKMSTGIGNGFAIPHANCRGIASMTGAMGISSQGIDFDALDKKPVHIIFLLAISEKADETHLHVLNLIFKLAGSEMLTLMKNAKKTEEIHAALSQIH
jgi:mannitol/fructose-specific phosphotransferase system IIA component (Ntr-type)